MSACPFCQTRVPDDLERLGGPCPHCFNEIPGEEAATDPGLELKAAEFRKEQLAAKKQKMVTASVIAVLLVIVVSLVSWTTWKQKQAEAQVAELLNMEFEDLELISIDDLAAREEELRQAEAEAQNEELKAKLAEERRRLAAERARKEKEEELIDFGGFGDRDVDLVAEGEGVAGSSGTPDAGLASIGGMNVDIKVGVDDLRIERGAGLQGSKQNTAVLERLFAQKQGDVKRCWETAAPGLKGRWRLSVELQLDGSLSKVSFEPEQGVLDTGFQTCVVNKASRWTVTEKTDTVTSYSQPFTF